MLSILWTVLLALYVLFYFIKDVITSCCSIQQHVSCMFSPLKWARGPVAQTLLIELLARFRGKRDSVYRQILTTDDDQDIVLDWVQKHDRPRAIILLLHGIGSDGYKACYIQPWHQVPKDKEHGLDIVVMNRRGHLPTHPLKQYTPTMRLPSHADVEDVMLTLDWLNHKHSDTPIFMIGYSSGANHVLTTAGVVLVNNSKNVRGIIALSSAVDLAKMVSYLENDFPTANRLLGLGLAQLIENNPRIYGIQSNPEMKQAMATLRITDMERAIARLVGKNETLEEYWGRMSSLPYLKNINIPTLFVLSEDDSLIPPGTAETVRGINNPNIQVLITKHGGHVGWIKPDLKSWVVDLSLNFIAKHMVSAVHREGDAG
jgi:uncharacterized protein